jgi:hypothetical protein
MPGDGHEFCPVLTIVGGVQVRGDRHRAFLIGGVEEHVWHHTGRKAATKGPTMLTGWST